MFGRQKMWPDSVAQSDTSLTSDQESWVFSKAMFLTFILFLLVQSGNSCMLHTIFSPETKTRHINV